MKTFSPLFPKIFMRLLALNCFLLFSTALCKLQAQDTGMHFIENKSWEAVLQQAKLEKKHIFVDCYTTWCGPCKQMSQDIFPLPEVGKFYNENFINVKFQLDTTGKDNTIIKERYADAAAIMVKYKVQAFPTYLFLSPEGELVHRELGSSGPEAFITKGMNALKPETQYYTQVKNYEAGKRDGPFLRKLVLLARDAYDEPAMATYLKAYEATSPDLLHADNLRFVYETTKSTQDTGFSLMMNNKERFETVVDKKELERSLKSIVINSEFAKNGLKFSKWDQQQWNTYNSYLKKTYPLFAPDVLFQARSAAYVLAKDWLNYAKALDKFIAAHPVSEEELNNYAWTMFLQTDNKEALEMALGWSKKSFAGLEKQEPGYIDTYANLLYKLGRKKEALDWEFKAQQVAVAGGADKSWGQDVIDKINKGEKTWK